MHRLAFHAVKVKSCMLCLLDSESIRYEILETSKHSLEAFSHCVVDRRHINADPDPTSHCDSIKIRNPDPAQKLS
jgi:hypothetical protein